MLATPSLKGQVRVLVPGAGRPAPSLLGPSSWQFRLAQVIQAPSKPAQCLLPNRSASFAYLYAWESISQTQAEAPSLILHSCSYSAPAPREPRGPWRGSWWHQGCRCPSNPAASQAWYVSLAPCLVGPKAATETPPAQPAPSPWLSTAGGAATPAPPGRGRQACACSRGQGSSRHRLLSLSSILMAERRIPVSPCFLTIIHLGPLSLLFPPQYLLLPPIHCLIFP